MSYVHHFGAQLNTNTRVDDVPCSLTYTYLRSAGVSVFPFLRLCYSYYDITKHFTALMCDIPVVRVTN